MTLATINCIIIYNLLCSFGFLPLIVQPTRVVENQVPSLIYNIFCNNISEEINSGNIYLTLSEHFCPFASVKREKIDIKNIKMYARNYSNFSSTDFHDDVSIQKWNYDLNNSTELLSYFFWRLEGCVNRHAPIKKLNCRDIKLKVKPWITAELSKMTKIINKLFEKKKRQPINENVKYLYNVFRNRVNRELKKKTKKKYYATYFEEHSKNIKKMWEGIRSIVNTKNSGIAKIAQLNVNGRVIDNPKQIVNEVNDFFVNVGPNTEKEVPKVPTLSPDHFLKIRNQFNFIIAHISNEEVIEIIKSLQNKATGPSSITLKLLHIVADLIVLPLCHIINMSFSTGEFPEKLKIVKVIPIHKGGSTDINNFRPISLLSIFDKIIEKIMHSRLYDFLEHHSILFENQFGFRKNNSTSYALMEITEKIK